MIKCNKTGNSWDAYQDYLKSDEWAAKKEYLLSVRGYRCERCRSSKSLQAHHKTYESIGNESESDLLLLCRRCHKAEHDIKSSTTVIPVSIKAPTPLIEREKAVLDKLMAGSPNRKHFERLVITRYGKKQGNRLVNIY